MADLFISYSRKDKTFVQKLQQALEAEGQSVWVDWEDIPLTADWRAEIRQGIQESDAVIFTISPDFLASRECLTELEIAQEFNKRLIPLVYREVEGAAVPPALTSRNWIFFHESDNFDLALQSLIQALETDLEWVKAHTRLTIRAAEWNNQKRNDSFLLRGDDLSAAELLLTQTKRQPELTPLQIEYILASRQSANRRQRMVLAAVTLGFVVALVLSVVAYLQFLNARASQRVAETERDRAATAEIVAKEGQTAAQIAEAEAQTQRDIAQVAQVTAEAGQQLALDAQATAVARRLEAERAARIARSGQLAALAQAAILEDRPQRSLILAAEALRTADGLHLPNVETVLWQTLTNAGGQYLDTYPDTVTAMAISPDSRWLIIVSPGQAQAWDLHNLDDGATDLPLPQGSITAMAISPDSQWLVIANEAATQVWDLANLTDSPEILGGSQEAVTALAISPDSRQLATGSVTGVLQLWDLSNLTQEPVILPSQESQTSTQLITFSPDQRWLATLGNFEHSVRLWNLNDLEAEATVLSASEEYSITGLTFSPDSRWLAIGSGDTYLWDLSEPAPAATPIILPSHSFVRAMAISADNHWLATGNEDNTVHLWDLTDPEAAPTVLYGHSNAITSMAMSADHRWLITGSLDHTLRMWDLANLEAAPVILRGHDAAITTLALSPDHRWLVSASADQTARLWDLAAPNPAAIAPLVLPDPGGSTILAAALTPDGRQLISANDNGTIQVRDMTGADGGTSKAPPIVSTMPSGHESFITTLAISPDSRWLATGSSDTTIRLWNLQIIPEAEPPPFVLRGHQGPVTALAFSPDGHWLATGSDDFTVHLWDLTASDPAAAPLVLPGHEGSITALAFSPDNRWLVSAGGDRTARLWDLAQGTDVPPPSIELTGHEAWIRFATISADNRWLVTADESGVARLWKLQQVEAQVPEATVLPALSGGRITALSLSPDSHWLAIAGLEGATYLWNLENILDSTNASFILRGHTRSVLDIAIDPGSQWLVTGSFDGTARLWDLRAPDPGMASVLLSNGRGRVFGVEITPDAYWLVTSSAGSVTLWTLSTPEQISLACRTAGRNLTPEEWEQYFSGEPYRTIC